MKRHGIVAAALGSAVVFIFGIGIAVGNVMHVVGIGPTKIGQLLELAREHKLIGDLLFAVVPLTAIAILNILKHTFLNRKVLTDLFFWIVLFPLAGLLIYCLTSLGPLWTDVARGTLSDDAMHRTNEVMLITLISLLLTDIFLSVQSAWLSAKG